MLDDCTGDALDVESEDSMTPATVVVHLGSSVVSVMFPLSKIIQYFLNATHTFLSDTFDVEFLAGDVLVDGELLVQLFLGS